MTDLVERLREMRPDFIQESGAIMLEAANEIERLRAENESLLAVYESANSVLSVLTMDHRLERNLEAACEQYEALSAQEHE